MLLCESPRCLLRLLQAQPPLTFPVNSSWWAAPWPSLQTLSMSTKRKILKSSSAFEFRDLANKGENVPYSAVPSPSTTEMPPRSASRASHFFHQKPKPLITQLWICQVSPAFKAVRCMRCTTNIESYFFLIEVTCRKGG